MLLAFLAALIGMSLSCFAPVAQFCLGLIAITALGCLVAFANHGGLDVLVLGFEFFVAAQMGYGLGIGMRAVWVGQRGAPIQRSPAAANFGEEKIKAAADSSKLGDTPGVL